ncbi:hypothetical protein Hamer_G023464 [Homarus americanus]|uniref:Uncharacterized protein n=1 Tax=Homarus americanus TaxID=6706 RepID=A0A8J5N5D7_HOMAM|nr:hypothetical protein Hamer_G023464 [Homarus americanus]
MYIPTLDALGSPSNAAHAADQDVGRWGRGRPQQLQDLCVVPDPSQAKQASSDTCLTRRIRSVPNTTTSSWDTPHLPPPPSLPPATRVLSPWVTHTPPTPSSEDQGGAVPPPAQCVRQV